MYHTMTTSNKHKFPFNTFLANIKMKADGKAYKWLNFSFKTALMIRQKYITNTKAN